MHCINPEQYFMHTLQALALRTEAQREYLPYDRPPSLMISEYQHWLNILHGRDDWTPSAVQQEALVQITVAMEHVEELPMPDAIEQIIAQTNECPNETLLLLERPGWSGLRVSSRLALLAFGWECVSPPISDFKRYNSLAMVPDRPPRDGFILAITLLNIIRRRPNMYFNGGIEGADAFLTGYSNALLAMTSSNMSAYSRPHSEVYRGWKLNNVCGAKYQMQQRGWSEEAILDELFCIEIDALVRMLEAERRL